MTNIPSTVLVTGGAGYIGSHTVVELLGAGYQVVVLDNLSNAYIAPGSDMPESLNRVNRITKKKVIFERADITNKSAITKIFQKFVFQFVIHFAALKAVGESWEKPLEYYKTNVDGTLNLLEAMRENNVKNLIYSSSATVYGDPAKLPITEDMPTGNCTNPYGRTKYMVEEIFKDLCSSDKTWSVISLRYFNPIGAHPSGELGEDPNGIPNNLMPYIAQVAVGKRSLLKVYGNDYDTPDGTGVRDYIHIQDLVLGHVKAMNFQKSQGANGFNAINLGTGKGHSVFEMIHAFERASGKTIPYRIVARRPGDATATYADASLAKKKLNWTATKTLDDMCIDTWNWQRKNPNGFKPTMKCT
ncbi:UDP-glucose 4-epimerase-like [Venturia canescens]|uniref:UDP-glucose 4-epimerase-like n=1 Tax=Venturia canescens TaxID=32260 RepID=UPI001C9CC815|nr:UDP-glucose 4-epimerase-like [Venturia canescens]